MVDHVRSISASTSLMIRDLGGDVQFWIKTGSSTYNYDQGWSYGANGSNTPLLKFRLLQGGNWQHMGTVYVPYDQTIRFTVYGSGIGFPTYDFFQHIQRSTVPGPPHIWDTTPISSSQIRIQFSGSHDGGSPILEWQIGYGANPHAPEYYVGSDGSTDVGFLGSGSRVYFWARGRNAIGWSGWSNRTEGMPWRIPDPPSPVEVGQHTQVSIWTKIREGFNGGTGILERELSYGTDPVTPQVVVSGTDIERTLTDLNPGRTYYFWSRVRNSVGWGPSSERVTTNLVAGAKVKQGNVWVRAVPYVRIDGTWRVARPWVRNAGGWKETSA
jgi:hypothetical protein